MPRLTIDGKEIEVEAGTNLIEAARRLGIEVPHYCYHPGLSIAGQCRLCMVDIEKTPRPSIACNTPAADGMVVHTQTERVKDMRRSMMEFHLINHPLDCPVCDQAGSAGCRSTTCSTGSTIRGCWTRRSTSRRRFRWDPTP